MFAIVKTGEGYSAKETPHYSKISDEIDVNLSKSVPVILVLNVEDVESIGIDPATVTLDGAEPAAAPAKKEEPVK